MITLDRDFYSDFITESEESHFYNDLIKLKSEKAEFNNWVGNNFHSFITINDFDEVVPSRLVIEKLKKKDYVHRLGQCHYSAKALCILLDNCDYVTGFIRCSDSYYPILTHSFNLLEDNVTDISRFDEDYHVIKTYFFLPPHEYFGIVIPKSFVNKYKEETFSEYSMKPLLYEWYKDQTGQQT